MTDTLDLLQNPATFRGPISWTVSVTWAGNATA